MKACWTLVLLATAAVGGAPAQRGRLGSASWAREETPARVRERLRAPPRTSVGLNLRPEPLRVPPRGGRRRSVRPAGEEAAPATGMMALGVTVAAVGALLAAAAIHLVRSGRRPRARRSTPGSPPPRDLLAEGDVLLAGGDEAGALRAYYLHAVAVLRREGVPPGVDHLADRAVLERLGDPAVREPFRALSESFQPVRYGSRPAASGAAACAREASVALARALAARPPEESHATG